MGMKAVHLLAGLAMAAALVPAGASQVVENRMVSAQAVQQCQPPQADRDMDPVADREGAMAQYEALPAHCLKAIVVVCSRASGTGLLDLGHAAACSIGYEALLKRGFGGDFQALVAWWQKQRVAPGIVEN